MRVPDLTSQKCSLFLFLMTIAQPQIPRFLPLVFFGGGAGWKERRIVKISKSIDEFLVIALYKWPHVKSQAPL